MANLMLLEDFINTKAQSSKFYKNFYGSSGLFIFNPLVSIFLSIIYIPRRFTAWKVSVFGVILVRISLHLDWIQRDTPYLSVFSPNARKCGKNTDQNTSKYGHILRSRDFVQDQNKCSSTFPFNSLFYFSVFSEVHIFLGYLAVAKFYFPL